MLTLIAICYYNMIQSILTSVYTYLLVVTCNRKTSVLKLLLDDLPSAELLLLINRCDSATGNADIGKLEQATLLCQCLDQLACLGWGGQVAEDVHDGGRVVDICVGEAEAGELHAALDDLEYVSSGATVDDVRN